MPESSSQLLQYYCLSTQKSLTVAKTIPSEWKSAIVTPLFKHKVKNTKVTKYRGISVLTRLSKVFEKLLNEQIVAYLDENRMLFKGQHGFSKGHSCETALHEPYFFLLTIEKRLTRSIQICCLENYFSMVLAMMPWNLQQIIFVYDIKRRK